MIEGRDILIYLAIIHDGDYKKIVHSVRTSDFPKSVSVIQETLSKMKSKAITIIDPDYPQYLFKGQYPPVVLFYYGDISLISQENFEKNVAIIGSRECSSYGEIATRDIVSTISPKYNIVSGMAKGIDGIAQSEAVKQGGKTIAVLGSGIDNIYPVENLQLYYDIINSGGLIVSEYPGCSAPVQYHFPVRDRIIAQLSRAVVVTEAYGQTGTSITVGFALQFGHDVLAIPYPYDKTDSFCNQLLYEGALFVRNGEDVKTFLDRFWK